MRVKQTIGLSSKEAAKKLEKYGFNEIEKKREFLWARLVFDQFKSPLIYILLLAGIISLILTEWTDALVIFLAVVVNTSLGFFQEFKAEGALIALQKLIVPHALVIRGKKRKRIEAAYLVPGDLVILKMGDRVPADGILIKAKNLYFNEAILTGESEAVEKKVLAKKEISSLLKGMVRGYSSKKSAFMGTTVVSGKGRILVTGTGKNTRIGQLAIKLKETVSEETPLKIQITKLARTLTLIIGSICLIIFVEGVLKGRDLVEMFILAVALAVAAIPEGLAISVTMVLTLGMERILKKKGLVRKLLAAETLGSVDVICLDKTGTLTEGKVRVAKIDVVNKQLAASVAVFCNNLINPLGIALWDWGKKNLKLDGTLPACLPVDGLGDRGEEFRIDEIPFSSKRKITAVLCRKGKNKGVFYLSGAPEVVLELSGLSKKEKLKWEDNLNRHTGKGFRAIGLSFLEGDLEKLKEKFNLLRNKLLEYDGQLAREINLGTNWLGLVLFEDPVREGVKKTLDLAQKAGIEIKVITGDYQNTAVAVLNRLGLVRGALKAKQVMEGGEVKRIGEEELSRRIEEIILFYRTTPEQKTKIVAALQNNGRTVAMMGDGVNDALALKKADIGIVVGEASEVAKETADMVLLDSSFSTVIAAIKEGRAIFENIKKVVLYLLSSSFSELILIGGSLLFGFPLPILPAQILWVNLIEDGLPGLALAFEKTDKGLMQKKPRVKKAPILDKEVKTMIFVISLVTDLILLSLCWFLLKIGCPLDKLRTIIFAVLAADSLLFVFSCKNLRKNLWQINVFSNKLLNLSVILGFVMLLLVIYLRPLNLVFKTVPLKPEILIAVLLLGGVDIFGIEVIKLKFRKKRLKRK